MHKKELISRLQGFIATLEQQQCSRGQWPFANFLIYYLGKLNIPNDEKYDFWHIDHYLPEIMVDAFEQLRTSTDAEIIKYRKEYEMDAQHEVPNIIDIGASDLIIRSLTIQSTLGYLLKDVMKDDQIYHRIETYCNAQVHVVQQTFDKFTRLVYRRGLGEIINKCSKKGMSGKFGETQLRTMVMCGRIMFTFAKLIDKSKESYYKEGEQLFCNEWNITFVGEEEDPLLLSAGIQSVCGDFRTCLDLIDEVIKNWPTDETEQKNCYKQDPDVNII